MSEERTPTAGPGIPRRGAGRWAALLPLESQESAQSESQEDARSRSFNRGYRRYLGVNATSSCLLRSSRPTARSPHAFLSFAALAVPHCALPWAFQTCLFLSLSPLRLSAILTRRLSGIESVPYSIRRAFTLGSGHARAPTPASTAAPGRRNWGAVHKSLPPRGGRPSGSGRRAADPLAY